MKAFFMKLLKDKATKKAGESLNENGFSLSPLFKYAIFGGGGFVFFLLGVIVICVVVFGPFFLAEEYFGSDNNKAYAYDYCGDACGENESKFYSKLNEVRESYKSRGVTIDTNLISGTVFYGSTLSRDSFDPDDPDSEQLIDDSKIHVSDVKSLASNMVSGSSLDYGKYRSYLVSTYIPKRFKHLYNDDKGIEKIADEIMSYANYDNSRLASSGTSYLSILCPEICTTDKDCWSLEEYVSRVVSAESGMFDGLISNYQEQWKAQAVAARTVALEKTNYCKKPIENSQNVQVADRSANIKQEIVDAVKETEGKVLTYEGEITSASYDSFYKGNNYHCDNEFCYATYNKTGGGSKSVSHEIKVYKKWEGQLAGGHGNGMSQFGAAYLADTGMKYNEILSYFYSDDVEITFIGGIMGVGEITEGILFPLGVNTKTGECVSAGNYYFGGTYHGAVDIAGGTMGYFKPYEEIPVVSSTPGVITGLVNNAWCTDVRLTNGDTRLPRVPGCSGNFVIILNDDPNSKYYNYRFIYYHFDSVDSNLRVGDHVQAGQMLGYMGSTGNSTGYHLHYGIKNPSGGDLNNTPVQDYVTGLIRNYCAANREVNK